MSRGARGSLFVLLSVAALLGASAYSAHVTALERLRAYRLDLTEALGEVAVEPVPAVLPRYPERRELRLPVSDVRIGLLDLLEIQGCELGVLVGERNSPLGRVMAASERWIYEARLVEALSRCPVEEEALRGTLEEALAIKRAELPVHRLHAVWNGPELRALLSSPHAAAAPEQAHVAAAALDVLREEVRASPPRPEGVRASFQALHGSREGGGVLRALPAATAELDAIRRTVSAATRGAAPGSCPGASAVRALFRNHYVGAIQPGLVEIDAAAQTLTRALGELWRAGAPPQGRPAALARFAERTFAGEADVAPPLARFRAAVRGHAQALSAYAEACGFQLVGG